MQFLVWLIVGFSAAVILPNEIGTPALPAFEGERITVNVTGTASQLIADTDAGFLTWHREAHTAQSALDLPATRSGDPASVGDQHCRLQV